MSEHPPALVSRGQTFVTERDQRDHAQPRLELDRDLPRLGRLGRLLRPREAAGRRRERLRDARARARDQPVREARLRRPPGPELRRLPQVHRGRLPARAAARPDDGRPARTRGPTCASGRRSSATCGRTSTSRNRRARRSCCRCIRSSGSYCDPVAAPVHKDEELELDVESLAYGGNGVARLNGFVVFVRRGLPGDRVRARVTKVKRSHAEALATEVVRPGPARVEAPCRHFPECGGCRFQDLEYAAQLAQKQSQVRDAFQRLAKIAEPPLEEIVPCEPDIFHYRNKMEYSFTRTDVGAGARPAPRGSLGRGARDREVLADDGPRQRDPRRGARVGARGGARGVLAGGRHGLPAAPRSSARRGTRARCSSSS